VFTSTGTADRPSFISPAPTLLWNHPRPSADNCYPFSGGTTGSRSAGLGPSGADKIERRPVLSDLRLEGHSASHRRIRELATPLHPTCPCAGCSVQAYKSMCHSPERPDPLWQRQLALARRLIAPRNLSLGAGAREAHLYMLSLYDRRRGARLGSLLDTDTGATSIFWCLLRPPPMPGGWRFFIPLFGFDTKEYPEATRVVLFFEARHQTDPDSLPYRGFWPPDPPRDPMRSGTSRPSAASWPNGFREPTPEPTVAIGSRRRTAVKSTRGAARVTRSPRPRAAMMGRSRNLRRRVTSRRHCSKVFA